jgi:hypothetical protein
MHLSVIICHRYHTRAGGKCLRALRNRGGHYSRYTRLRGWARREAVPADTR